MQYQISVIISIYNIEKYISCCVDSVLKQSYHDYEIILVNDGSCDKSGAICQEYAERFPNIIRYVYKENGGLSSARNAGLLSAHGDYVYFIDGDDYILPDTLKSFVEILDKYGELDFIHGRMSYFSNEDPLLREQPAYINNEWQNGVVSGKQLFANAF